MSITTIRPTTRGDASVFTIVAMLFAITMVNYADRATLAITGGHLKDLGFTHVPDGFHLLRIRLVLRHWANFRRLVAGPVSDPKPSISPAFCCGRSSPCCKAASG